MTRTREELIRDKVKGWYPNEYPNRKQRRQDLQKRRKKPYRLLVYGRNKIANYLQRIPLKDGGFKTIEHFETI